MEPAHYADPLEEALSHGSQRVAQLASLAAAMAQVVMQRRTLEEARKAMFGDEAIARVLQEQEHLLNQQARLRWAPAHDARWLAQAGFVETARAWAGAAADADTDPTAASALRRCEDKLRTLHPYAMARYDRLRDDGLSPLDAMGEAAPLFARAPDARVGDPAVPRHALGQEGSLDDLAAEPAPADGSQAEPDDRGGDLGEQRGRRIVERLQENARAGSRAELGADELAMVLEAATNLSPDVIDRVTQDTASEPARAGAASGRSAARIAAESFPRSASDAVQAASVGRATSPGRTAPTVQAPAITKRPCQPL